MAAFPAAEAPALDLTTALRDSIYQYVRGRVRSPEAADDLTQEVLLRAATKAETVRRRERLESWLFQIARNAVIDHHRRSRPAEEFDEARHAPAGNGESGDPAGEDERLRRGLSRYVRDLVEELPPLYREALALTEYEGLSQVELARRAGISVSAAKSRVQRAREEVRKTIQRCCRLETDRYGAVVECEPRSADPCKCSGDVAT